ncbi:MAG: ATP-binding protein [Coriobacteriia bacterium]|nr:ATP-binding protein [Coriobacteriia bacterium]
MAHDRVTLTVPAKSEYAKTVRMTAAALVGHFEMTYDEVDDVRMAADEAFVYAAETVPEGADVKFEFTLGDDSIAIDVLLGREIPDADNGVERSVAYAVFILEAVCDSYEFASDEAGAHLRIVKRVGNADAND